MKTVSVTEFRNNIKRYLDIAQQEKLVIHRNNGGSFVVTPLEEENDETLLSESQKRAIDEALEDVKNGNIHSNKSIKEQTKERFPHLFK